MPELTSIVIAVWDALPFLKKCIGTITMNTDIEKTPYEIILVDNGSKPDAVQFIKSVGVKLSVPVKTHFNNSNLGCSIAWNQGIIMSEGKYICLLNSDTEPQEKWLEHMRITIDASDDIGVVGPMCNNISSIQGEWRVRMNGPDFEVPPGYVMPFVCVLFKREIFKKVGLMAERFDKGGSEDIEMCNRLHKHGLKKMVAARAFVHHYLSRSYREHYSSQAEINKINREMNIKIDQPEEIKYLED